MKLTELMHVMTSEKKEGLIKIDDWRWPDVDHLVTMGFDFADDHHMVTEKEPKITIYKKKAKDEGKEEEEYFFIEEPDREVKRFKKFNDVIDYFDKYDQPEIDNKLK